METFPNIAIRASAGTGKTFQLSNRYISLVNAGEPPERILAITFTRKAAGEIQGRILTRLVEAASAPDKLSELQHHIGGPPLDLRRCLHLLRTLLQHLHRLRISTLDSFFIQIAGGLALEVGLPVAWQIAEDIDDRRLRAEAMQVLLKEDALPEWVTLMRLLSKGDATRTVSRQLFNIVTDLYDLAQQTEATAWQSLPRPPPLSQEDLREAIHQISAYAFSDERFTKARDGDMAAACREDWEAFVSKGLAKPILYGKDTYYRKPIDLAVLEPYRRLIQHAQAILITRIARQNDATWHLLDRFGKAYQPLKFRRRTLRFDDITRVLADALTRDQLDRISYRLDAPVRHLLLDEFQDTSVPQWKAMQPFAEMVTERNEQSFFCVGDVKQAIYGWRGGVSELMDAVITQLPHVTEERLNHSYRSSQVVMDTVNTVFDRLDENTVMKPYPVVVADWRRRFDNHTTERSDLQGHVSMTAARAANEGEEQSIVTLQYAAEEVARLHHKHPERTIGILVRRNQTVARLIYALRHTHRIMASEEGGNPLTDSVAVQLILSLLRLADHPGDTVAGFHVAHSPLGGVVGLDHHDDKAAMQRVSLEVRQDLLAMGYGRTIYGWVRGLVDSCDQRELNRLLQLVDVAYSYEPQATERTVDFVMVVRAKRVEAPTAAPVRVMTIHQAKGLQFDIVVLPELDVNLEGQPPPVVVHRAGPTLPIEAICRHVNKELRPVLLPPRFQEMFTEHSAQVVNESLCLLYVAMTRAIHALHMMVAPPHANEKTARKTFASVVRVALCGGAPAPPETVLYEHGMPDWQQERGEHTPTNRATPTETDTAAPQPLTVQLRVSSARRARGLKRIRPSQAAAEPMVTLAERLRPEVSHAMLRGALLHAWLEQIEWLDDGEPTEATLCRVAQDFAHTDLDITAELQAFRRMLEMSQTRRVLSRCGYDDLAHLGFSDACCSDWKPQDIVLRVFRERPFAVREPDAVVYGSIDRLVLVYHRDRLLTADILDFKSDTLSVGDASGMQEAIARYQPQMAMYRQAMARQFGLEVSHIATRLLFLQLGEVQRA
ncbi:RecBCD enzyme subunit RecB [Candidatus Entotheonellaceae bacterium PAL068K]